jgi:hypothetical protein
MAIALTDAQIELLFQEKKKIPKDFRGWLTPTSRVGDQMLCKRGLGATAGTTNIETDWSEERRIT